MQKIFIAICLVLLSVPGLAATRDKLKAPTASGQPSPNYPMEENLNLNQIQEAFNDSLADANVKIRVYKKEATYKIRLRQYMTTTIVFPKNEHIITELVGDKKNFTVTPVEVQKGKPVNIYSIYGKYAGADTNAQFLGESGNIYNFYVRIDDHTSEFMPTLTFYMEDPTLANFKSSLLEEPVKGHGNDKYKPGEQEKDIPDYLEKVSSSAADWDSNYQVDKPKADIAPTQILADKTHTYFRFGTNGNMHTVQRLPVVYIVRNGRATLANTHVEGEYLVAEHISDRWEVVSGDEFVCIRHTPDH